MTAFVLTHCILFCYVLLLIPKSLFFSNEREGRSSQKRGGKEGEEILFRFYYMRKESIFNKRRKIKYGEIKKIPPSQHIIHTLNIVIGYTVPLFFHSL